MNHFYDSLSLWWSCFCVLFEAWLQNFSFCATWKKIVIQVWNNLSVTKWWQILGVNYLFNFLFCLFHSYTHTHTHTLSLSSSLSSSVYIYICGFQFTTTIPSASFPYQIHIYVVLELWYWYHPDTSQISHPRQSILDFIAIQWPRREDDQMLPLWCG